jgi:hypothetical protein
MQLDVAGALVPEPFEQKGAALAVEVSADEKSLIRTRLFDLIVFGRDATGARSRGLPYASIRSTCRGVESKSMTVGIVVSWRVDKNMLAHELVKRAS